METSQSVRRDDCIDWMVSIDLNDACPQVPVHPESQKFLRFVAFGKVYQFKVLCFGFSMVPQVYTRVMAPVSIMLHDLSIWILRYLDNLLILASSREEALLARDVLLNLCRQLGILINFVKSHFSPIQSATYLGMVIESSSLKAFPSSEGISILLSQLDEFLSYRWQNVVAWRSLLGRLSLCHLVMVALG